MAVAGVNRAVYATGSAGANIHRVVAAEAAELHLASATGRQLAQCRQGYFTAQPQIAHCIHHRSQADLQPIALLLDA